MRLDGRDLRAGLTGADVAALHRDLVRLGFEIPEDERSDGLFGAGTARAVADFQRAHGLPDDAVVTEATASSLDRAVAGVVDSSTTATPAVPAPRAKATRLEGHLYVDDGQPAQGVTVRFYERGFGGKEVRVGEALTGPDGQYTAVTSLSGEVAHLDVRAVGADGREIPLVEPACIADGPVDLVVPADRVPAPDAEYVRLLAALKPHLDGARPSAAREDSDQRDISLLHEATQWDARLIALAATADELSARTGVDPQAVYGMLRAGLPTDPARLARVGREGVGWALGKAVEAGVVALTPAQVKAAQDVFDAHARAVRRVMVGPGTVSNFGAMLTAAGLNDAQKNQFDQVLSAHTGHVDQLWQKVRTAGLPADRIQLAARLGTLTFDNAPLVTSLIGQIQTPDRLGQTLVQQGLYRPQGWQARLESLAGGAGGLAALIPPAYEGATVAERLAAYTADLAYKVRLSYPTQVVSRMVRTGDLPVGAAAADAATVLERAATAGLSLGRNPLNRFLRDHAADLFRGLPADRIEPATAQVKRLHRLYQITRSDEALKTLLDAGLGSAHEVTAVPYQAFLDRYGDRFPSRDEAALTWRKAQQVGAVTHALVGAVKQAAVAPPVPAASAPAAAVLAARDALVRQFPTLESLFGSLDFCECEHCRSVLSPAAYLVDVLRFLDPDPARWAGDVEAWRTAHGGATYPFATVADWDAAGRPEPKTPYDVLTARRPDLPVLPLTCENTNTALPYIDVVNEILEYHLVHGRLAPDAMYDTGDAGSADLIAEPQNLLPAAYDTLKQARYPLTLPFDLWLETARRFAAHFDTALWRVLEAMRTSEELAPATGYGLAAVAYERLGFGPEEVAVLTGDRPLRTWPALYGFPPADTGPALAALANAKELARRLGVSYRELVALVRTAFVNPRLDTLATLRKLGVDTEDVLRYHNQPGQPPFTPAERAAFEARLGPAGLAWVREAFDAGEFRRILVLASPDVSGGFENTTLRYASGAAADGMAFLLLNYLVRVWRRLGWSMEATDRALTVFLPGTPDPRTNPAIGPAMATALLGLSRLDHLADLLDSGPEQRRDLPSLWATMDDRRYAELFLTGSAQTRDAVFDHPLGRYLTFLQGGEYRPFQFDPARPESAATGNVGLRNHLGPVQAALGLSLAEIGRILTRAGARLDSAPLNMITLSLLHRRTLLAGWLGLSMADLLTLTELSGLDPFTPPHSGPVTTPEQDHPYQQTIRFVTVAAIVRDSGLRVDELDYLLRHRFDPVGPHRAASQPPLDLVRGLVAEITRIRAEHAEPADPLTFTDEVVVRTLALVLEPVAVETFRAAWTGEVPLPAGFFDEHLRRRTIPGVGEIGFLEPADAPVLFQPRPDDQAAEATRRGRLAAALLPHVRDRLVRQFVTASVATALNAEPEVAEGLLTNPALLDDPNRPGDALLPAYVRAGDRGLTSTANGVTGYLEVPVSGAYRFSARCAQTGTRVELRFDHLADPVLSAVSTAADREPGAHVELRAGVPYGFSFTRTRAADLLVQGRQLPKAGVERLVTYPRDGVDHLHRVHLLLAKALRLADALGLTGVEIVHLLTHRSDFDGLDLGELPTRPADDSPTRARALFDQFLRLAGYMRLRRDLAAEPADLVDVLAHARRRLLAGADPVQAAEQVLADVCGRVAAITRRDPAVVRAAAGLLGMSTVVTGGEVEAPDFTQERGLTRLWDVLALATRLGVDPATLRRWADPRPDHAVAADVRNAVKARYEPEQWRRVAQPIYDQLRERRRDALVAHILHTTGRERPEQLFEDFLVDPGTEPVAQTSRLRLAVSSVQTFVQRCLLNLEPGVHPSALDAGQWEWMKRYRVWEANRKIFLWPENWLEPEFRDDKTHLFAELESGLLEGDLDDERAGAAFVAYLRGLEEIARLDVRSVYVESGADPNDNVVHVVARTFGTPHKYFYRRQVHRMWTPWVPVTADIESDHVVVTVWRGRVHLFWVTFLEKAVPSAGSHGGSKAVDMRVGDLMQLKPARIVQARLSWTDYVNGSWGAVASSRFIAARPSAPAADFNPTAVTIRAEARETGPAVIHLTGEPAGTMAFKIESPCGGATEHNLTVTFVDPPYETLARSGMGRFEYQDGDFSASYYQYVRTNPDGTRDRDCLVVKPILRGGGGFTMVIHPDRFTEIRNLLSPFFLADARHTFFVQPVLTETPVQDGDQRVLDRSPVDARFNRAEHWAAVSVAPRFPGPVPDPPPLTRTKFAVRPRRDSVTSPGAVVPYGGRPIREEGGAS
jgi:hypothetical protein